MNPVNENSAKQRKQAYNGDEYYNEYSKYSIKQTKTETRALMYT